MSSLHTTTLTRREPVAADTTAFHFERPPGFGFKTGQAVDLILDGADGGLRHAFSLVSAPHEDELVIATRMRDTAYKRALAVVKPGATVHVDGPFGALTLHKDARRPAVMIAGGIGITPFVGMLRQAAKEESAQPLRLVYSSRTPRDAAYLDELRGLTQRLCHFRLLATMTDSAASAGAWTGETRRVDAALVSRACAGLEAPIYYLAGPPGMVRALRDELVGSGVDEEAVRCEEFYGY